MEEIIMAQYAFDRAISVAATYAADNTAKNISKGDLAFWAEQITEPTLNFTSEQEEIMDARNNVVMVLQNGRGATFGASNAFFNTSILAAQVGAQVKDSAGGESITKYEMVATDDNGNGSITYTPVDDCVVYELETDGSFKTAEASTTVSVGIAGKPAEGTEGEEGYVPEVKANPKGLKGATKNSKYLVVYEIEAPTGERITALADAENELLNVTAEVLLRDLCDQTIHYAFLFMRGKLSGEAEWGMARDGAHAFEITAMPAYCDAEKKLVDIVIVKDEALRA
jgi:hypothetical protein